MGECKNLPLGQLNKKDFGLHTPGVGKIYNPIGKQGNFTQETVHFSSKLKEKDQKKSGFFLYRLPIKQDVKSSQPEIPLMIYPSGHIEK